jgi:hypothetical protein
LSAPKKGKDLSALKARLAKKAAEGGDEGGADTPAPAEVAAAVPAPGEVAKPAVEIPAPGEIKKPDIPAPGEVKKPVDIPAPGQVLVPEPAPAPTPVAAAAPAPRGDIADDPMSGGASFDPNAGLIDDVGGEVKSRSGAGLALFAGLGGVVVGIGLGFMLHKTSDLNMRKDAALKKAEVISAKIAEIDETRSRIALKVGAAKDALEAKEGDKAVEELLSLEPTYVELADLFGWQLAAMNETVVKNIFDLAEANNRLQLDVQFAAAWTAANKDILAKKVSAPSSYVVISSPAGGVILAEYVSGICEDLPDPVPEDFKPDTLKKCEGEEILNAKAYMVRTEVGGPVSMAPAGQAFFLNPTGGMYTYAIAATAEGTEKQYFDIRLGMLTENMDKMVKLKDDAATGIANYTDDPPVSGD